MAASFTQQSFTIFSMLFLVGLTLTYAYPHPASDDEMVHNDNYFMIMAGDHEPSDTMQYQNFDEFFKAEDGGMAEMEMDESRNYIVLAPQPWNMRERFLGHTLGGHNMQRAPRFRRALVRAATMPHSNSNDWDKYDNEM